MQHNDEQGIKVLSITVSFPASSGAAAAAAARVIRRRCWNNGAGVSHTLTALVREEIKLVFSQRKTRKC